MSKEKAISVQTITSPTSWGGVYSLTIGVAGLVIAEFLPVGVLTPMARELNVTEGMAGQAVSASAIFATLTSLLIAYVTRKYNRKTVLLALSSFLTSSSLVVAFAPNFTFLIFGRILLGIAVGGFWSMAAAIAIRLVPEDQVPKALAIIFGGSSFASVFAAPMGSFLGDIIGWRNVFFIAAGVGFLALIWQMVALPSLKPVGNVRLRTALDVIRKPQFTAALIAINLVCCGRFASFTYLRPFLENTTHVNVTWISAALLTFGLAYFAGNWFTPGLIKRNLRGALAGSPFALAVIAVGMLLLGQWILPTMVLVFLWGASFAPIAPGWSTWIARTAPEHTETGGGLFVASIQFAATAGALLGGVAFDHTGSNGVFILSGLCWLLSGIVVCLKISNPRASGQNQSVSGG